jgi:hypothetical protein
MELDAILDSIKKNMELSRKKQISKTKPKGFKVGYHPSELFGIHANVHYFNNFKS